MSSREDRVEQRAKQIREEEGASHGRNPETMDPEMLEGEDAETVKANKEMKRKGPGPSEEKQPLTPEERLPPD